MPTNLPPECAELKKQYLQARGTSQKMEALQRYLASIPKHKGTERLCATLKTRLAKLRLLQEKERRSGPRHHGGRYAVKKEGAAQVVILGLTDSGKSSLMKSLTNARPAVYGYPFTTTEPVPGMMEFEDIQIQLVEAPAIFEGASEGDGWGLRVLGLARNADALLLVVDLSSPNPTLQLKTIITELDKSHINIVKEYGGVEVERQEAGGIQVISLDGSRVRLGEVKNVLRELGVDNCVVKVRGEVEAEEVAQALLYDTVYKPTLVVANKVDVDGAKEKLANLREAYSGLEIVAASAAEGRGVNETSRRIFQSLKIIRVYTKRPRQPPSVKPMIMGEGATVADAAKIIHRDLYEDFKYARLWGSSNFPGERVGLNHALRDKDVLEIRI